ncbi:MAG: hypothetical protein AAFY29_02350 [Pseudomonadota bacterium]
MTRFTARMVVALLAAMALSACGKSPEDSYEAQSLEATITFDAEGCPISVSEKVIEARRRDFITWSGVDANGEKAKVPFVIFFDPLHGRALRSKGNNLRRMVNAKAPIATYKYTIVGRGCPDKPLDPTIRVAR